jgi:dipeptidyl aminopeptidase/acylaminoacyl peptidase
MEVSFSAGIAEQPKPGPSLMRSLLLSFAGIAFCVSTGSAQASFTAEDALDITMYQPGDLTADGRWLAATSAVRRDGFGVDFRRDGDPTYIRPNPVKLWVIDTRTGQARTVYSDKRNIRSPRWSSDGSRLAFLELKGESFVPVIWDRATGKLTTVKVPAGKYVAENSDVRWTNDGTLLVFSLRANEWRTKAREMFASFTAGPVFVQSSKEPFLSWEALRRLGSQVTVVAYNASTGAITELVPETKLGNFELSDDGGVVVFNEDITKKTDYDVIFGTENQLVTRKLTCATNCVKTVLPSLKNTTIVWARDNRRFAYSKDGRVFVSSIDDTTKKLVAGLPLNEKRDTADTSKATRDRRERERFAVVRYSPIGDALVISNKEGLWLHNVADSSRSLIVATSDSNPSLPRVQLATWSNDGRKLYFTTASRLKWERGVLRYDRDSKKLDELVKDGRSYSGLRLSKDGSTLVLNIATGNRPADLYVADASLQSARRLVETNPQLASKRLPRTDLLAYLDSDGHKKYGVVYYPPEHTAGKTYPTVFNIYEEFFDDTFDANANILASRGYVVVKPSVDFDIGYPGEAWIKGVTSAANKLIELGVADSTRLGVHGTSYGGYATNLLITQTQRFRAAINISGKVDIISFYTDSPRLGVRNVHAAEKSQDRLGATLWQQPQRYVAHSAIMFADRIKTPLLLITGQLDSNVPADNTREMYYALRRLDKEVVWVNYMNGGHGGGNATVDDFLDMQRRIVDWYDAKLKRPDEKVAAR